LRVGDRISINDNDAVVVGTYKTEKEFFWDPVMYTTYSRAVSWAPAERRALMYVLVKLRNGADLEKVKGQINTMSGLRALTNTEYDRISTEQLLSRTGIKVNFGMMAGLGFFIGMLVAGQTFYTFVLDNLKLFGAMKAMGATNGMILRMMAIQVAFVGFVGYGLGVGLACITGTILERGGLAFYMTWHIPVFGGAAVILCSMLAGILGMVRVIRLEPAVVFK
jgi:putative ABC transport system permease protein